MSAYRLQSGRALADRVEVPESEQRLLANWHGIQERRAQRRTRNVARAVGAASVVLASVCAAYLGGMSVGETRTLARSTRARVSTAPAPLRLANETSGHLEEVVARATSTDLSDGSRIIKDEQTRVSVLRNDGRDFSLKLELGHARRTASLADRCGSCPSRGRRNGL